MSKYRMVEASFYTGSVGEILTGRFMGIGEDFEEFEDGVGQFTTAIIELPDGTVRTTHIENIRFTTGLVEVEDE